MIPKKRKRPKMNVRPPDPELVRSKPHLRYVRDHHCCVYWGDGIICSGETEAHHIYLPGDAKGRKPTDSRTVPLCQKHHEEVGRQIGREAFEAKYKVNLLEIAETLWRRSPARPKWEAKMKELENA